MKKIIGFLFSLIIAFSMLTPNVVLAVENSKINDYGTTYYLDSTIGKSNGDGLSEANAFDSLDDINQRIFQPGDQILIKAGSYFTGTLYPKGSGCAGYPIVIDMYGNGAKPVIDGNGAYFMPQVKNWKGPFTGENGDQIGSAVYLYNQEYIEINNLNIKNTGDNVNRDRSGIRVEGYDYGVINHIYIRNCDVHDVRGYNGQDDIYPVIPTNPDGSPTDGYNDGDQNNPNTSNTFWGARTTHRTGGINLVTYTAREPESKNSHNVMVQELDTTKKITRFNDILIENNTIENCQANGITTTNVKGTLDDTDFRHTQVIIRNNNIHNVTRAGIIPIYTSGVIVEHNKVDTFQSTTEGYGCGIWCDRADGMIFQYNEVCNGQNGNDGMAFNLDDMTRDGVIQYNYTHDNYGGGYMLHVRQKSYNRNNTIRYNLSINDSGVFAAHNAQIVAVGETDITKLESAKVYNNTFISNKDCHAVFEGDEVNYNNNIWYFTNATVATRNQCFQPGTNSTFKNNAYIGCVAPPDSHKYTDNPNFVGGNDLFNLDRTNAYIRANLKTNSSYIGTGIEVNDNGGKDILGQTLKTMNLGAFGGIGHDVKENLIAKTYKADDSQLKRYLSDASLQTTIINETVSEANTKWVNTTFNDEPVIYTKQLNNYIEIPFSGTGGTVKLKRGAGAGNMQLVVYSKDDLTSPVKTVDYNSYNATADTVTLNDFQELNTTNQDYILRVYNKEETKASNFMNFISEVASDTSIQPGCINDKLAGIVIEKPLSITIPYAKNETQVKLTSHLFMNTCNPQDVNIPVTYTVNKDGQIQDNILIITKPGTYTITASATYKGVSISDTTTLSVDSGNEPQVNVAPLDTRALDSLIRVCQNLDLTNYAQENKEFFDTKLEEAVHLLNDDTATQDNINQMVQTLRMAKEALIQIRFDAEDDVIIRTGNWVTLNDSTLDKGSALKSGVADEKLSLTFNGNEIKVYGRKAVGTDTIRFIITKINGDTSEQVKSEDIDTYSETKKDQELLFNWQTEDNGIYSLDIINTGIKNSTATNRDINTIIDYMTVGRNQQIPLDTKALADLINEYENIELNQYQDNDDKNNFIAKKAAAKQLLDTATSQKQLDDMVIALTNAKNALKLKTLIEISVDNENIKTEGQFTQKNGALITEQQGAKIIFSFKGEGIELINGMTNDTGRIKVTLYLVNGEQESVVKTAVVNTNKVTLSAETLFSYYGVSSQYRIECENLDTAKMIINGFKVVGHYQAVIDKTQLDAKIKEIEQERLEASQYTQTSYDKFVKVLNKAKDILSHSKSQQQVNDTLAELITARNHLVRLYQLKFEMPNGKVSQYQISAGSSFKDEIHVNWPTVSQNGYHFNGWVIKGQNTIIDESSLMNQDLTVVPSFTLTNYTITYHDGKDVKTENFTVNDSITLKKPTKSGYQFIGWFTNKQFTGDVVTSVVHMAEDLDLYAKWQKIDNHGQTTDHNNKPNNHVTSDKKENAQQAINVKTGDDNNLMPWMILSLLSFGFVYLIVKGKKKFIS